ncbi:MAG: DUF4132 domain-containing protein [Acidobacteriota bacterium]
MAFEQMAAFLGGTSQEDLGPTEPIGVDGFPLLAASTLREEHVALSALIVHVPARLHAAPPAVSKLCSGDETSRTRLFLALVERVFSFDAKLSRPEDPRVGTFFGYGSLAETLVMLLKGGVDAREVLLPSLRWLGARQNVYYELDLLRRLVKLVTESVPPDRRDDLRLPLLQVRANMLDGSGHGHDGDLVGVIDSLLGEGLWQTVMPGEVWADEAIAELGRMPDPERAAWLALLTHCHEAKSAKPSPRWLKGAAPLLARVGDEGFRNTLISWFGLVDKARSSPRLGCSWEAVDERQRMHDVNGNILRGLLWLCPPRATTELCRAITKVALSSYRKVRGLGPRAVKVGNAAVASLGGVPGLDAVGQLALLKTRVRTATAQKEVGKALDAASRRAGISASELEEMGVPTYGLNDAGVRREELGDVVVELTVQGASVETHWFKAGKPVKLMPASVKADFAEEAKDLLQASRDIQSMIPVQAARLDQVYLDRKTWPFEIWRERYLDHPLVGTLARRLLWRLNGDGQQLAAMFHGGRLVDSDGAERRGIGPGWEVTLWHPLDSDVTETLAWRRWLSENEIQQPFKQAHREVYLLTDAERATATYSNRFAAHVLKQHQFNALCAARGWRNKLRLMVDDAYPPASRGLPAWGLRAEYWIEGAGTEYGTDTTESGAFLHVATDQVRFYRSEAASNVAHASGGGYVSGGADRTENHPVALEEIPKLALSEVLRDVDLFVGVASVANDPTWSDGGPHGRYRDYWHNQSFGELGATARTRKDVLEKLVPRLKVASRCTFEDRFLVVRGDVRNYRIHLGSGNILMEPNNAYLCIVPKQSVERAERVFLPFEGDQGLSIIISKAFMLANDKAIRDASILSQIRRT